jgi:hypothetical protein
MEFIIFILLGMLWLSLITPPSNNNDEPIEYWNNGR